MSPFKKIKIELGWFLYKCKPVPRTIIILLLMLCAYLGAVALLLSFVSNREGARIVSLSIQERIFVAILVSISFYLYTAISAGSSDNFKIAITKAEEFAIKNPQCLPKINRFIRETRGTKDPAKLDEWISNWQALSFEKGQIEELEKEKEDMEKGIPLKEVKDEIETRKERVRELESNLA